MSDSQKGRVSIAGVVVLENGRVLDKARSPYNHIFDGHVWLPASGGGSVLAALRYFNPGEPLSTPYAYFITAQVAAMPLTLPKEVKGRKILIPGLETTDYKLIGDIKQLIPFGPVNALSEDDNIVNPCIPPYVFACGAVSQVMVSADRIVFKLSIEVYMAPLDGNQTITVSCVIPLSAKRWKFLVEDPKKRKTFIKNGTYVSVEGRLTGMESSIGDGDENRCLSLVMTIEEVTLLGRAPVASTDIIDMDDSPLRGKGKKSSQVPSTPLRFSYSALPSAKVLGKRRAIDTLASSQEEDRPLKRRRESSQETEGADGEGTGTPSQSQSSLQPSLSQQSVEI